MINKKPAVSQEDVMKLLDSCYEKCLNGIPKVSPILVLKKWPIII